MNEHVDEVIMRDQPHGLTDVELSLDTLELTRVQITIPVTAWVRFSAPPTGARPCRTRLVGSGRIPTEQDHLTSPEWTRTMNSSVTTAAAVASMLILVLSGCTATATPAAPAEVTSTVPAIDPGPVDLTAEQASERYLSIVCPANQGVDPHQAAFVAGEDEYFNGGSPDPAAVKASATELATLTRAAITFLDDDYYVWPSSVSEHIAHIRTSYMGQLTTAEAVANAETYAEAYNTPVPATTPEQDTAGQEIRYQLDISSDTKASCIGYEEGHTKLAAERAEREAALAEQE